jgi:6-phosphogluconolactonase
MTLRPEAMSFADDALSALPEPLATHAVQGGRVFVYASPEAVAEAAKEFVGAAAFAKDGDFRLGLAGGGTPQHLYRRLAHHDAMPWDRVHLYWSDERMVPHTDTASNVAPVREALVDRVAIPDDHVHPMPTDADTPEENAARYHRLLSETFGPLGAPTFDVSLLGLGEDGHTASLFPEDFEDGPPDHGERYAIGVYGPPRRPPRERISMTVTALSNAVVTLFLVTGARKADGLRAATQTKDVPASHIGAREAVVWLADEAAAERLAE